MQCTFVSVTSGVRLDYAAYSTDRSPSCTSHTGLPLKGSLDGEEIGRGNLPSTPSRGYRWRCARTRKCSLPSGAMSRMPSNATTPILCRPAAMRAPERHSFAAFSLPVGGVVGMSRACFGRRGRSGRCVRSRRHGQRLRGASINRRCAPTPRQRRRWIHLTDEQRAGARRCP